MNISDTLYVANREDWRKWLNENHKTATEEYEFPPDIVAPLRANKQAWENFQRYSGPYQRIRVAFIDAARKRPGEFEKRLRHFIRMTEQDKQYGFGIEEYY